MLIWLISVPVPHVTSVPVPVPHVTACADIHAVMLLQDDAGGVGCSFSVQHERVTLCRFITSSCSIALHIPPKALKRHFSFG